MKAALLFPGIVLFCLKLTAQVLPDQSVLRSHAPAVFEVVFTTGKGSFTIEVHRDWSPEGADRFFQLAETGFYRNNCLFRVQKNYVIQFGIGDIPGINSFWDKKPIEDEPVLQSNLKRTVSYARDGMHSRTSQIFINLKDNFKLDTVTYNGLKGFTPFGKIVAGFETIEALNGEYGFEPAKHQDSVMVQGNSYWNRKFPRLDYILDVEIKAW